MKSLAILIFLWFMSGINPASAQFPNFPDSNAFWGMYSWGVINVTPEGYHESGITGVWGYHFKELNEDTILQGTLYNVLWSGADEQEGAFAGGIRMDTTGEIYYFHPNTISEYLLYDFGVEVGDSLVVWVGEYNSTGPSLLLMHVVSLDTLANNNGVEYRKVGIVNDGAMAGGFGPEYWIQGVGGSGGLLSTYGTDLYPGDTPYLDCMSHNDTLWPSGVLGSCPWTLGIHDARDRLSCAAFPNPSTGLFHLSQAAEQITVYNAQGKLLFRQNGNEVDLSAYPPGVYTAVMQTAKGNSAQRLVVVR